MRRQLTTACVLFPLVMNGVATAAPDTELPRIPQALRAGQACTPPSGKIVSQVPWQLPHLGAERLWPLANGSGVTVAVVDTGVDQTAVPVVPVGDGGQDCVGHGTVVASLIAAPVKQGTGPAGLAPGARLLAVRATDRSGAATAASIAAGIDAAVAAGARVLCVAPVTTVPDPVLRSAVERATAAGVVVVAASGPDITTSADVAAGPYYPAAFPGVLSVTAIGPDGKRDERVKLVAGSLAAPGVLVVGGGPGGGHVAGAGPAFAAAHVAATVALVKSYTPQATPLEVVGRLRGTAHAEGEVSVIDPLAAMTAVTASNVGRTAQRDPLTIVTPPDLTTPRITALAVAGGVTLLVGLIAAAAVVVPRGRRRGWRAGGVGARVADSPQRMDGGERGVHLAETDELSRNWGAKFADDEIRLALCPGSLADAVHACFDRLVAISPATDVVLKRRSAVLNRLSAEYLKAAEALGGEQVPDPALVVDALGKAWDTALPVLADYDRVRAAGRRMSAATEILDEVAVWRAFGLDETEVYDWVGAQQPEQARLADLRAWIDDWLAPYDALSTDQLRLVMLFRDAITSAALKGRDRNELRAQAERLVRLALEAPGRHSLPWLLLRRDLTGVLQQLVSTQSTLAGHTADQRGAMPKTV